MAVGRIPYSKQRHTPTVFINYTKYDDLKQDLAKVQTAT